MTDRMTSTSVQRRRRWSAADKMQLVEQTFAPGMTVSLVARQNGAIPSRDWTHKRV